MIKHEHTHTVNSFFFWVSLMIPSSLFHLQTPGGRRISRFHRQVETLTHQKWPLGTKSVNICPARLNPYDLSLYNIYIYKYLNIIYIKISIRYIYICICIRIYVSTTTSDYIYIRLYKYVSSFPPKFRTYACGAQGPFNSTIYPLVVTNIAMV